MAEKKTGLKSIPDMKDVTNQKANRRNRPKFTSTDRGGEGGTSGNWGGGANVGSEANAPAQGTKVNT